MGNYFILNSCLTKLDLIDAINERIMKSKSMTSYLLSCDFSGDDNAKSIYGIVWALDGYLEELDCLFGRLDKINKV